MMVECAAKREASRRNVGVGCAEQHFAHVYIRLEDWERSREFLSKKQVAAAGKLRSDRCSRWSDERSRSAGGRQVPEQASEESSAPRLATFRQAESSTAFFRSPPFHIYTPMLENLHRPRLSGAGIRFGEVT